MFGSGFDRNVSPFRSYGLPLLIAIPAKYKAVLLQAAGVFPTGTSRDEGFLQRRGLAMVVIALADDGAIPL